MKVKVINKSKNPLPEYETEGSAGLDLRYSGEGSMTIFGHEVKIIPTGLYVEIPRGYELQIRPRSGLAVKKGLTVLNTPGTIDSDYRGEIKVILFKATDYYTTIEPGERIAQAVLAPVERVEWEPTTELSETERGDGGFGHTGTK